MSVVTPHASEQISCQICGASCHAIHLHLKEAHPEMNVEQYQAAYPEAPVLSEYAKQVIAKRKMREAGAVASAASAEEAPAKAAESSPLDEVGKGYRKDALHTLFGLRGDKSSLSASGKPIPVTILTDLDEASTKLVPTRDSGYVFNVDVLKDLIIGLELNIPTYIWGHAGTGKSTLIEQVCSITNRPMIRIQHSANTEESHITGQWTVVGGETVFQPGLLLQAMRNGWTYVADEYDFANPSVLAVYQAVLEGKPCVVKEASDEWRVTEPSAGFRFVATGNTNGAGDETGLYQGTMLQNAANYERFGMVVEMPYMDSKAEAKILSNKLGLVKEDAQKLVTFANLVREQFKSQKMMATISPRALLNAANIGIRKACFKEGLKASFINRLSRVDKEVAKGLAQRVFG